MRLKVRSPRRHHPTAPRIGGRVAGVMLLILLLFNLAHLQARPSEEALTELHALGTCACCAPAPPAADPPASVDSCCSPAPGSATKAVDSCCAADGPPLAHAAQLDPPAAADDGGCCGDGHGACHCQQTSQGLSAWLPRPVPLPEPPALANRFTAPVQPQLEGGLAPPEQPPRA